MPVPPEPEPLRQSHPGRRVRSQPRGPHRTSPVGERPASLQSPGSAPQAHCNAVEVVHVHVWVHVCNNSFNHQGWVGGDKYLLSTIHHTCTLVYTCNLDNDANHANRIANLNT